MFGRLAASHSRRVYWLPSCGHWSVSLTCSAGRPVRLAVWLPSARPPACLLAWLRLAPRVAVRTGRDSGHKPTPAMATSALTNQQINKHKNKTRTNKQTNKQTNLKQKTNKQTNIKTKNKQTNTKTKTRTNKQTNKHKTKNKKRTNKHA
ncbi:unnamed protein product [Protopolystoma xenopodis]|uniref:Uncharacterized protein n=1 Tax=Protopolystoma xenopodis TaxID=117903 RepID=A0A3S5AHH8_9PLAT|nr:unnamed protein product [Protopolystoma xenopodis]